MRLVRRNNESVKSFRIGRVCCACGTICCPREGHQKLHGCRRGKVIDRNLWSTQSGVKTQAINLRLNELMIELAQNLIVFIIRETALFTGDNVTHTKNGLVLTKN